MMIVIQNLDVKVVIALSQITALQLKIVLRTNIVIFGSKLCTYYRYILIFFTAEEMVVK